MIAWLSGWAPVCCLFFLRFVSSRAGSLIFSLSSYLSMHCVLIMPPAWVLVWSSDARKSLPCRTFPLLQPLGCPSLVGFSPCARIRPWCAQAGKHLGQCTAPAAFLGVSREHRKRDWYLMLIAGLWKCSWQWLFSLFSAFTCTSSVLPNLLFLLSEPPLKTLSELFTYILIFKLYLSAEMPGANCFSWTAAHELTYNLIQVIKG